MLAATAPATSSFVGTGSPQAVAPPFLYVNQNELLEYSSEAGPTLVADLADFGASSDAIRLGKLVFVLREQGLQRVTLIDGSSDLVVHFDPPARFGALVPQDDGSVIYQLTVDAPQAPGGMRTVIGLFQPSSSSDRIVLSVEQNMTLLGQTADGNGLYLLPRGQDPSFSHVLEVLLASGEITAKLAISGDPGAELSPDRRWIVAMRPQDALNLYDLTSVRPSWREVAFPETPSHTRDLVWSTNGYVYFSLLAGNYYDYDPDHPPASYGLWRLDAKAGKLCHITQGHRQERQLLAVSPDNKILVTGDVQGTVLVWDMDAGQVTAEIKVPQGELYATGPSSDGQWLPLRHTQESFAVLVHLPTGTGASFTLSGGAIFAGWCQQGDH